MTAVIINGETHQLATCPSCKCVHSIPPELYAVAQRLIPTDSSQTIVCPYGHKWHYTPKKEMDANEQTRLERDRLKQKLAEKDDTINEIIKNSNERLDHANRKLAAQKGKVTRLKNRAAAGVCPCCNRTFQNLKNHMASQHPTFTKEEAA